MMNSTLSKIVIFAAGAAVGSVVTMKLVEKKYARLAQEEIDSVKEMFRASRDEDYEDVYEETREVDGSEVKMGTIPEKPDIREYAAKLKEQGYINYADISKPTELQDLKVEADDAVDGPYVITPEEFDTLDGYEAVSLTYYADDVLTDDMDNVIDDVDDIIGLDSLSHFGEYEDDSVFVRDDRRKKDYEVLLDQREYSSVKKSPHPAEDE